MRESVGVFVCVYCVLLYTSYIACIVYYVFLFYFGLSVSLSLVCMFMGLIQ